MEYILEKIAATKLTEVAAFFASNALLQALAELFGTSSIWTVTRSVRTPLGGRRR